MKTAIIFWSGTGSTEAISGAILDGLKKKGGSADIFKVSDITPAKAAEYDRLILGCPAMGAEVLEESEFEPFYSALQPLIKNKTAALFGSYDWGDGEWMVTWRERAEKAGINILDTLIINVSDSPYEKGMEFGSRLV